ncbi:MAG: HAMP domain-containing protein [Chloroflexi bacterium]|nr:HAMP domain-containing protein [Chloroflexota bacterium]
MNTRVLIVQSDSGSARVLAKFFQQRRDRLWRAGTADEALALMAQVNPELVVASLQLKEDSWLTLLQQIQQRFPQAKVIITTKYPDIERELRAKEQGARAILRRPFTREKLEGALAHIEKGEAVPLEEAEGQSALPRVRIPVRIKITFPYAVLSLLLALAASYVISRVTLDTIEERFTNQVIEAGKLTSERMVREENRLLESLRLLANVQGASDGVLTENAELLRVLALPLAINAQDEAVEILNKQGIAVLSLRHRPGDRVEDYSAARGDNFASWAFVQNVLQRRVDQGRDKFVGLARATWGDYFYVAGPVLDDNGKLAGAILIGKSVQTLARLIRQDTLAQTTMYDADGQIIASTLSFSQTESYTLAPEQVAALMQRQASASLTRDLSVSDISYTEILGTWKARGVEDLGVIGASLPQAFLVNASQITRLQIFLLVTIAIGLVIGIGLYLANRITTPLLQVVAASAKVAQGNLETRVDPVGNDEVAVLGHSFNYMVSGLREGSIYRDLLGRTVSPQVREQLRQTFASGDLRLEGQTAMATVLMADIRGFTPISEKVDSTTVMAWLNEYFGDLVPIIVANGGVVDTFVGDALMAFFGILPRPLESQESATLACRTAIEMLGAIERLNERRITRGEAPFITGIGVNTGTVAAGGLGASDRLHYTIIGDTVNTTQRLESLTRQFGESGAVVSESTVRALGAQQDEFKFQPLGAQSVKGKAEEVMTYRLRPHDFHGEEAMKATAR